MAGFLFRLELEDGAATDPSTVTVAVPDWPVGRRSTSAGERSE
jgi:hypothetical protein